MKITLFDLKCFQTNGDKRPRSTGTGSSPTRRSSQTRLREWASPAANPSPRQRSEIQDLSEK